MLRSKRDAWIKKLNREGRKEDPAKGAKKTLGAKKIQDEREENRRGRGGRPQRSRRKT